MKLLILAIWMTLQLVIWPLYFGSRLRGGMAMMCCSATFVAFWLGWAAR